MRHYKLGPDPGLRLAGFSTDFARKGETCKFISKGTFSSDDKIFYRYISQLSNTFLGKVREIEGMVLAFVVVIHPDNSADLYAEPAIRAEAPIEA